MLKVISVIYFKNVILVNVLLNYYDQKKKKP